MGLSRRQFRKGFKRARQPAGWRWGRRSRPGAACERLRGAGQGC